jgi:hypothetical protein
MLDFLRKEPRLKNLKNISQEMKLMLIRERQRE